MDACLQQEPSRSKNNELFIDKITTNSIIDFIELNIWKEYSTPTTMNNILTSKWECRL